MRRSGPSPPAHPSFPDVPSAERLTSRKSVYRVANTGTCTPYMHVLPLYHASLLASSSTVIHASRPVSLDFPTSATQVGMSHPTHPTSLLAGSAGVHGRVRVRWHLLSPSSHLCLAALDASLPHSHGIRKRPSSNMRYGKGYPG